MFDHLTNFCDEWFVRRGTEQWMLPTLISVGFPTLSGSADREVD